MSPVVKAYRLMMVCLGNRLYKKSTSLVFVVIAFVCEVVIPVFAVFAVIALVCEVVIPVFAVFKSIAVFILLSLVIANCAF